ILISHAIAQAPSHTDRFAILEYHNQVREGVFPTASNMQLLSYSYELERLAMQWVAQCRWEHPDPKIYTQYRGIGQNLALYGGYVPTFTKMAEGWYNEVANYTYYNNHCSHVCGHYTQMVWASTTHLGCAMRRCDNIAPHWPKPVYLMACQYAPGGNFYGMRPYDAGQTCSKCPAGYTCYRRQCSKVPHYTKRR
uniref:SCP domain-containing protein n=1 Tax=Mesocestoides corti TaxID=53468 RepID=A0A5K3F1M9_MESCO